MNFKVFRFHFFVILFKYLSKGISCRLKLTVIVCHNLLLAGNKRENAEMSCLNVEAIRA